jgi:drug/metabolite transporter (DMT)-like permease
VLLLGADGLLWAAGPSTRQPSPQSRIAVLASLGITCCWLAYALLAKRRRRPRVRYQLRSPEDL